MGVSVGVDVRVSVGSGVSVFVGGTGVAVSVGGTEVRVGSGMDVNRPQARDTRHSNPANAVVFKRFLIFTRFSPGCVTITLGQKSPRVIVVLLSATFYSLSSTQIQPFS